MNTRSSLGNEKARIHSIHKALCNLRNKVNRLVLDGYFDLGLQRSSRLLDAAQREIDEIRARGEDAS